MIQRLLRLRAKWRFALHTISRHENELATARKHIVSVDAAAKLRIGNLERCLATLLESPIYVPTEEIGLNGQRVRKMIFTELLNHLSFHTIIETGTFTGNSTGFFCGFGVSNVFTCELNPLFIKLAKSRLRAFPMISFLEGDSRVCLQNLALSVDLKTQTFFYLDAHWNIDLPLIEEISIICRNWKNYVIMIDDFEVPNDDDYGYDSYNGTRLNLSLIACALKEHDLSAYFPVAPGYSESGARRGCVILTPDSGLACSGMLTELIRKYDGLIE